MNINSTSVSDINSYLSTPVTMTGVASGVDWQTIIQKLMSASEAPLNTLETQKTTLQNEQDMLTNTFKPMLEKFRQSLLTLELPSTFEAKTASSSDSTTLGVSANANALSGTYQVKVDNLATFTTLTPSKTVGSSISPSATLSSDNFRTPITSGYFTINGTEISVDASTDSLNTVISNINNASATTGVTATYSSANDSIVLTDSSGSLINIGSSGDTSDFLQSTFLSGATETVSGGVTTAASTTHLGAIDPSESLSKLGISTGTFTINGTSISVDSTQTVNDLISNINNSDANVTAWYDSNADKIYLRSNVGGPASITVNDGSTATNVPSVFGWDGTATQANGQNAQIEVSQNGGGTWTTYTRSSNSVDDVIPGVTLDLYATTSTTPVTVNVSQDTKTTVDAVQNFVDSFNNIVNWINTQYSQQPPSSSDTTSASSTTQGALYQNEVIEDVLNKMKSTVYQMVSGLSTYNSLPSVGINTGAVGSGWYQTAIGTLSFNQDTFTAALQANPQQVAEMFTNDPTNGGDTSIGTGVIQQLDQSLYAYTKYNGIIDQYASNQGYLGNRLLDVNSQIVQTATLLKQQQTYYIQQYTAMEQLMGSTSDQSTLLSSLTSSSNSSSSSSSGS